MKRPQRESNSLTSTNHTARRSCGRLAFLVLLGCCLLAACSAKAPSQQTVTDAWLTAQEHHAQQLASLRCAPPANIEAMALRIRESRDSDLERMRLALGLLVQEFAYDPAYAGKQLTRTAEELFESRILGGCSDYALAGLALFRAMGHPCMLVVTVSSKWLERRRETPLAVGYGHSFIEVLIEGRWHLADPNHFTLYDNYAPNEPFYPHKELFMARGYDFRDLGLDSTADVQAMLERQAQKHQPTWRPPAMTKRLKVELDLPALFVGLGDILAGTNDFLALKRYTRALDFDADYVPAYLARGRLHLHKGRLQQALADLDRAAELAPDLAEIFALRAEIFRRQGQLELMRQDLQRAGTNPSQASPEVQEHITAPTPIDGTGRQEQRGSP